LGGIKKPHFAVGNGFAVPSHAVSALVGSRPDRPDFFSYKKEIRRGEIKKIVKVRAGGSGQSLAGKRRGWFRKLSSFFHFTSVLICWFLLKWVLAYRKIHSNSESISKLSPEWAIF
jgi:hypothetical protein